MKERAVFTDEPLQRALDLSTPPPVYACEHCGRTIEPGEGFLRWTDGLVLHLARCTREHLNARAVNAPTGTPASVLLGSPKGEENAHGKDDDAAAVGREEGGSVEVLQ